MSAIAAELRFRGGPADLRVVERMSDAMASSPGDRTSWTQTWVAVANRGARREAGSPAPTQPTTLNSLGVVLAFDGNIFNQAELREELGESFSGQPATERELIGRAYVKWGERFVEHINGVFAIVLYDTRRNRVVLARDRLGIKPLYLAQSGDALRAASTLPGVLAAGDIDLALDPVGLHHYLSWHSIVPAPRTILNAVKKLPPATIRIIQPGGSSEEYVYWAPNYGRQPAHAWWSQQEWEFAIERTLRQAVRRHLPTSSPVGVLLSGGLDSSLLVALASEEQDASLETFSIGFEGRGETSGDEFEYSDLVADHFGTRHHRIPVADGELAAALPHAVAAMSEPMASHDATAFYLLSRNVSAHTSVVQSGQGADEVFAGYSYHQSLAESARSNALQAFNSSFRDRTHGEIERILVSELHCSQDESQRLLHEQFARPGATTALDAVLRLDTHTFMVDDPVKRVDNMTRAWDLDARVPFLDHGLVELAAQCPPELKTMHGGKGILKAIGERLLPGSVVHREKGYFPVPGLRELNGQVLDLIGDTLGSDQARNRGAFQEGFVETLLKKPNAHRDQRGGNTLWTIAVLEMWLQQHAR